MKLSQISDDDERRFIEIPAAQLRALATILNGLDKALSRLPAARFLELITPIHGSNMFA